MLRHAILVAGMLAAIGLAATAQRFAAPQRHYTIDETESLVKADLAKMVDIDANEVRVAARTDRTWPDSGLGCGAGLGFGSSPVDGYAFTLKHAKGHFEYHTDRLGNIQRCRIVRPLAP